MQGGIQFSKHGCLQKPEGFGAVCTGMTNIISNLLGEQPGHPRASQEAPNSYVWLTKSQPISLFFRQNITQSQHLISDHPSSLVSGEVKGQSSLYEGRGCRADPPSSAGHGCICFSPKLLSPWRQGLFHNSSHWLPGGQGDFPICLKICRVNKSAAYFRFKTEAEQGLLFPCQGSNCFSVCQIPCLNNPCHLISLKVFSNVALQNHHNVFYCLPPKGHRRTCWCFSEFFTGLLLPPFPRFKDFANVGEFALPLEGGSLGSWGWSIWVSNWSLVQTINCIKRRNKNNWRMENKIVPNS